MIQAKDQDQADEASFLQYHLPLNPLNGADQKRKLHFTLPFPVFLRDIPMERFTFLFGTGGV